MSDKLVNYRTEDGVAVLELNNPPANSYTYEMMRDFDDAILEARFNESAYVIVIRGQGEKFFSGGADINMLGEKSPKFKYNFGLHGNETLNRLEQTPKLVIAAINGHAVGGGLEIAMAADIRIAKKDGGRMGLPEIGLGVLPGMGGTQRLPRLVGKAKAIELMVMGRQFPFEEALEMGLINDIYEQDEFFEQVLDYARQFIPPSKASMAVGYVKRAVQSGIGMPLTDALALEREFLQQLFQSEDHSEGVTAYREKRIANFKGR